MRLAVILMLLAGTVRADEAKCLASVMYAEARGESVEGVVAIGQATMAKASREEKTICRLPGVKRLTPPTPVLEYYLALAKQLVKTPKHSVAKGADHWGVGKPRLPGRITRVIGDHTFYVLN